MKICILLVILFCSFIHSTEDICLCDCEANGTHSLQEVKIYKKCRDECDRNLCVFFNKKCDPEKVDDIITRCLSIDDISSSLYFDAGNYINISKTCNTTVSCCPVSFNLTQINSSYLYNYSLLSLGDCDEPLKKGILNISKYGLYGKIEINLNYFYFIFVNELIFWTPSDWNIPSQYIPDTLQCSSGTCKKYTPMILLAVGIVCFVVALGSLASYAYFSCQKIKEEEKTPLTNTGTELLPDYDTPRY